MTFKRKALADVVAQRVGTAVCGSHDCVVYRDIRSFCARFAHRKHAG
jgi:hypothetical protein